jgi:hypothetical protein
MAIEQAVATVEVTVTATAYTSLDSMTYTPGAGTYLAVFSATINQATSAAETVDFCLFSNGSEQTHTTRHWNQEGSFLASHRFNLVTHGVFTVADSQAIDVRWKVTNTANEGYCQRRTLTLIPVSASTTQKTSTNDTTTASTDFSVTMAGNGGDDMTATPGAGTYLLLFGTTLNAAILNGAVPSVRVYVNSSHTGYEHTERQYLNEASFDNWDAPLFLACKVTPGAGEDIDIRWAETASIGTITAHERTLTLIPLNASDIKQAAAAQSDTFTGTSWELMTGADAGDDDMDIVDPGAGDWLALFSCNWATASTVDRYIDVTFYKGASQDTNSERRRHFGDSFNSGDMQSFCGTTGKVTLGAADDLELRWQADSSDTRTVYERTLVAIKESGVTPPAAGSVRLLAS